MNAWREPSFVKFSDLRRLAALPVSCAVRRTSLAAGTAAALFTGGLPFVGFEPGMVMGRATLLPSSLAFILHLIVAMIYGALFCLAISRSRDRWTFLMGFGATLALYAANIAVTNAWQVPRVPPESDALVAHIVFGATFTIIFKLAEIGAPEVSTPSFHSLTRGAAR